MAIAVSAYITDFINVLIMYKLECCNIGMLDWGAGGYVVYTVQPTFDGMVVLYRALYLKCSFVMCR